MKKVILAIMSAVLVVTTVQPVQGQDQRVLAIIDTAINSDRFPQIIHEVCFTTVKSSIPSQNMSCPNGELFMEGKGAASAPWPTSINNVTYHGDSMVKAALSVNPNIKIVFIRFSDININGNLVSRPQALISAINWVSENSAKYGIDAVSISQSGVSTDLRTKAISLHPECSNAVASQAVSTLNSNNVPVFAATGNDASTTVVGFPACVPGVVGVGSLASPTAFERVTNRGPGLDLVAVGAVRVTKYNNSATTIGNTSGATVVASSTYVSQNSYNTFTEYFDRLRKIMLLGVEYSHIVR
jgi:hypothetical protein